MPFRRSLEKFLLRPKFSVRSLAVSFFLLTIVTICTYFVCEFLKFPFSVFLTKIKMAFLTKGITALIYRLLGGGLVASLLGYGLAAFIGYSEIGQNMMAPSGSPTTSTQAQVGSLLGEERDERHGKESEAGSGTPPSLSDSKRVHPSSGSGTDTSFHSCSSSLSSPHSKEVDSFSLSETVTSSEIDFWKEHIRNLFLDPVERVKPPGLTLEDLGFGKRDAIEILAKNEKARDLVVERLFQPPARPVNIENCQTLIKALRQERWPNAIKADRGSPYAVIYTTLEDLNLR